MRKHIITVLKVIVSIAIISWLFSKAVANDQFDNLWNGPKKWGWLVSAVFVCLGAHFFAFARWRAMVRALGLDFSFLDAIRIGFIGCFFNLFAFGVLGGDSLRAFYVCREAKNRIPEAIASVVADRVIGLLTMFSVASLAFLMFDFSVLGATNPEKMQAVRVMAQVALVATITGFVALGVLMLSPQITKMAWFKNLTGIPKIGPIIQRLTEVFLAYSKKPFAIVYSILMSIGVNVCFALTIYFIAVGLGGTHPSLADHFLIEPIAMVANAAPLPGGIGGMEVALDFLYQSFSKAENPAENGIVVAFAYRFTLLMISMLGAFAWFANRKQFANLVPQKSEHTTSSGSGNHEKSSISTS